MSTLIYSSVFDPRETGLFRTKANDRATHHTVACNASHRCEVFARRECIALQIFSGCVHGFSNRENGPTKKARGCGEWVTERRKIKAEGEGRPLRPAVTKLSRVGDHVWIPYAHMDRLLSGKNAWVSNWRDCFIKAEDFTVDLIVKLAEARPRSLMGDEITHYQREEVPKFVTHLSEVFPDLAREAAERSPRIQTILASITKVGRKALLWTIRPNVGLLKESSSSETMWTWDGMSIFTSTRVPFVPFNPTEVRVVPGPNAVAIITDDAQVGPDTVFVD